MTGLLAAFFSSFIATLLIIRFQHLHSQFSADSDLSGPQKFHKFSVPRIGGISIAIGIFTATLFRLQSNPGSTIETTLLVCAIPTFAIGLTEDLTKKVGIKTRLIFTAIAAGMAAIYLGALIPRLDIPGIDYLLALPGIGIIFTIFAVTGLANAYNIIDGFNGLSSMVGIITLLGLTYVSYTVGDPLMMYLSLVMAGSILGFFLWNYPRGLIFLGDGGAYLIGFWIAIITVMLVARHQNISPWFALLINAYPILETLFTIYRRKIHQGKNPGLPDGIHFHTLIFRRILNPICNAQKEDIFTANAKTSPYLWVLTAMAIVPAILWWHSTNIMIACSFIFTASYIWIYKRVVTFKTPSWMHPY
ncbi:glycosyltransferase family 4 protein [Polynucleobacter sp. 71A-WALBACH]|uniref:MraY family glycosyltransferase n=1 Tax=Polynucleobacter sp. 71A-WALBACH TaxID=2689097 RepID=UPI001C0C89C4|nr:glycosyltransferase [Polynucleobacter sp. 71A-WALBACH]MBU3593306.1 glycosyltransferase family 4 protein [Polynucleobacter sp. 71A-WALBACH]